MAALNIKREIEQIETRDPPKRADRHYECPVCGQTVDRENLAQVDHHHDAPHEPLRA